MSCPARRAITALACSDQIIAEQILGSQAPARRPRQLSSAAVLITGTEFSRIASRTNTRRLAGRVPYQPFPVLSRALHQQAHRGLQQSLELLQEARAGRAVQ